MAGNYGKHKPMVEAKAENPVSKGKGKKTLRIIEARCGENGGYIVTHNFDSSGMEYYKPEEFVFGEDEGGKVLAHIGKALKIPASAEEAGEKEHEG